MNKARKSKTVIPFPTARRSRKRVGGALADARADALRTRFSKVSEASKTGDASTPLKRLLKRL
ncbi:hypothetical protein [Celeribacter neptunius]|uniref:Uncharacterized protein n=1 Tax=Celeribacter neptunius TaxID=588602 RepID=A0A1I3KXG4_9RHOB|nr:hypothetical protein [Celeribacter neptunius]SFI77192.1 hypothetical protein SAMN04487991_0828 [Celeribacter neptunius]